MVLLCTQRYVYLLDLIQRGVEDVGRGLVEVFVDHGEVVDFALEHIPELLVDHSGVCLEHPRSLKKLACLGQHEASVLLVTIEHVLIHIGLDGHRWMSTWDSRALGPAYGSDVDGDRCSEVGRASTSLL